MAPTLDIHVDNGVPGEDVIAMRISLNPSGQPSISDGSNSSIEDMLKEMLSRGVEIPGAEVRTWSCDCPAFESCTAIRSHPPVFGKFLPILTSTAFSALAHVRTALRLAIC